jgi:hypothetical protein
MDKKQLEIIAEIKRVAALLNVTSLTREQFDLNSNITAGAVKHSFGSWNRAIQAADLVPNSSRFKKQYDNPNPTEDELLQEIIRLTQELGKEPSEAEMGALGNYGRWPYRTHWGTFSVARQIAYTKYGFPEGVERGIQETSKPKLISPVQEIVHSIHKPSIVANKSTKKVQYGEPLDFRGLRHAPISEQGVVYLFGMVSHELGFLIELVREAYPDCEGKRCVDEKRQIWERTLIEFEFRSSNFRRHGHDPDECDLIVCWIHDWQDCPLEVIELRSAINRLPK